MDWGTVITGVVGAIFGGFVTTATKYHLARRKQDDEHRRADRAQIFDQYEEICDGFRIALAELKAEVKQVQSDYKLCIEEKAATNTELALLRQAIQHVHAKYVDFVQHGKKESHKIQEASALVNQIELLLVRADELEQDTNLPEAK